MKFRDKFGYVVRVASGEHEGKFVRTDWVNNRYFFDVAPEVVSLDLAKEYVHDYSKNGPLQTPVEMLLVEIVDRSDEQVDHPTHYQHPSGVEAIDLIEGLGFCLGTALKYLWRLGQKDDVRQDLEKARWYLRRAAENHTRCEPGRVDRALLRKVVDADPESVLAAVLEELDRGWGGPLGMQENARRAITIVEHALEDLEKM